MKLLLFACAIWTGAYSDPSVTFTWNWRSNMKHLQENTAKFTCFGKCNLTKIFTSTQYGGKVLVKGLKLEKDGEKMKIFCTSDWSLRSSPANTGQICKFDGSAEKPEGHFFIKQLCVNWENINQGCRLQRLTIELDNQLSGMETYNTNQHFYWHDMKHLQEITLKFTCNGKCNLKDIRTSHGSGKVLVKGLTLENDEEKRKIFCTSDWSLRSSPANTDQICEFDGSVEKPGEGHFFIKLWCVNRKNINQGCLYGWLNMDLDGAVNYEIYSVNQQLYWRYMKHLQETTLKVTCNGKCNLKNISTSRGSGKVLVKGLTLENDEEKMKIFCTSNRSLVSSPANTDQICKFGGSAEKPEGLFFIKQLCVNWENINQGCRLQRLTIELDNQLSGIETYNTIHHLYWDYMKHLQETTLKFTCKKLPAVGCNLKDIRTSHGSGNVLVKGLMLEKDEKKMKIFCTSDWSLRSSPANTDQICKFDESVEKPEEGHFFIKLLCVNWKNINQGCLYGWLNMDLDGAVNYETYIVNHQFYWRYMKHLQEITLKFTCKKLPAVGCNLKDIRTSHGSGKVLVKGLTEIDEEKMKIFCTSDWSIRSSPANTDQICKFDRSVGKPTKGGFFLKLLCVNWKNINQGCLYGWLNMDLDGAVNYEIYSVNHQLSDNNMAHGETATYEAVCKNNQCKISGIIWTQSKTGTVQINTYKKTVYGTREDICNSNLGTAFCQKVLRTGFYPPKGPFFIELTCFNRVKKTQGCQQVAVTMTNGNVENYHGPLNVNW